MDKNQVPAMNSVGLETIAVAKGPAGLMEAVMERLEEQTVMSVLQSQVMPIYFSFFYSFHPVTYS